MGELRGAREALGLSLEEVCERTRIPVKWLDALERGDHAAFPPGPFLAGYTRQYRAFLGLPAAGTPAAAPPRPAPSASRPVGPAAAPPAGSGPPAPSGAPAVEDDGDDVAPAVRRAHDEHTITLTSPAARLRRDWRMAGAGAAVALVVLAGVLASGRLREGADDGQLGVAPDQELLVTSASGVRALVEGDGHELFRGALPPGRQLRFAAHDRLVLELDALDGVSLVYNGHTLKPLGAQSRARRLVFVDDHGG